MNGGQFTHKAQEAIVKAQELSRERDQQQIDTLHLLYTLLNQQESIILNLLDRIGINIDSLKKKVESSLDKIPTIITPHAFGQFYLTQDMAKVLDRAKKESVKMGDEYISIEHLFLALLSIDTKAKEILDKATFLKPETANWHLQ